MKNWKVVIKISVILLLLFAGCEDKTVSPSNPASLSGNVKENQYFANLPNVSVNDLGEKLKSFITGTDGNFTLDFGVLTADYATQIRFRANGFRDTTIAVTVKRGEQKTGFNVLMTLDNTQVVPPPSNPQANVAAQIAILGVSANSIAIHGTGGLENSVIEYEVRDSLGVPVAKFPRYGATFQLLFYPNTLVGGGTPPNLIPSADSTDASGKLRTGVSSGTQAGVVKVIARIDLGGGRIVQAQPVKITVHGGFPDQRHFTVAAATYNYPGLSILAKDAGVNNITVLVADKFSNPVSQGTAVLFHSYHGMITTEGITDKNGFVTQTLHSSNPYPEGDDSLAVGYPTGPGWSYVVAQTIGEITSLGDTTWISDSLLILWTGRPEPISVTGPASYTITNGGAAGPWTFTVMDKYGHPMSAGTEISVTADGCVVSGNVNVKLPDTQIGGPGVTDFSFIIRDAAPTDVAVPPLVSWIYIKVKHPVFGEISAPLIGGTVQ